MSAKEIQDRKERMYQRELDMRAKGIKPSPMFYAAQKYVGSIEYIP